MTSDYLASWLAGCWHRAISHRAMAAGAVVLAAGCSLGTPSTPSLTGPSTLSLSLAITASPDLIVRDGVTRSVVTVAARDASGQPVPNLSLRMDVKIGGVLGDLGTLSSRTVSTGSDGRASVTYTAPPPAAFGAPDEATIQVVASPISTDAANAESTAVSIRLASPGVIQPPNGAPVPSFFVTPTSAHERETILFDGSASRDPDGKIMTYQWNFGDGDITSGTAPTATHHYDLAAVYQPTLTVTDDRGLSVTSAPVTLTIAAATNPVASFVVSPTPVIHGVITNFNGTASSVPTGRQIQTWRWDFGDGTSATTNGPTTTHTFAVAGTYSVVLTVTDDIGRTATVTVSVAVT
jgi:PKD repeat protein